jgi:hypothetical protein
MKLVWLVFFLMSAFIALLGSLLVERSTHSTNAMVETTAALSEQLRQQSEKLSIAQTQLQQVTQQLADIKQAQPVVADQAPDIQSQLREDRAKQAALTQETLRLKKWAEKIKNEKLRIQTSQQQIQASKRQIDVDEKLLDLEILTSVVESRVQKRLTAINAQSNHQSTPETAVALKGADVFGEVPYVPPAVQVVHTDTKSTAEIMARKVNLQESRKKLASHQHALDEDKRKLAKESAQLHLQQQAHAKALKDFSVGANP